MNQRYIPSQEQFRTVIDNLKKCIELAGRAKVNMANGALDPHCGTAICHGGWYAVAYELHKKPKSYSYVSGACLMANDLGFKDMFHLTEWANKNPKLWGNNSGAHMFNPKSHGCFGTKDEPTHLEQIIDHWKGVAERCRLYEESLKPKVELSNTLIAPREEVELV